VGSDECVPIFRLRRRLENQEQGHLWNSMWQWYQLETTGSFRHSVNPAKFNRYGVGPRHKGLPPKRTVDYWYADDGQFTRSPRGVTDSKRIQSEIQQRNKD
jgi:hypothetical protein